MQLTVNQKVKLKTTRQFIVAGVLLGVVFIPFSNGTSEFHPFVTGAIVGLILGAILAALELFVFERGARKIKFIWLLAFRTMVYFILITIVIFNVVVASRMIRQTKSYFEVLSDSEFTHYLKEESFSVAVIYTLFFAFSINFVRMISRKMGQGMLLSYILGTYYKPVYQERIIMFVNIVDSKKIANEIGALNFHKFLNKLFYDFTVPVISNRGIILEYVEDLMVITWAMNKGLKDSNCVQTYFDLHNCLAEKKDEYLKKYGFVPQIQAGLHTGSVVVAEVGEIKTEIAFHGDSMNTTARILAECSKLKAKLVVSDHIDKKIEFNSEYSKSLVGDINLKGKKEPVTLFEITKKVKTNG